MSVKGNCTICTDYFLASSDISVTLCGHLFHEACLSQWLKTKGSQKNCPQCRTKLTAKQVVPKLYVNAPDDDDSLDPHVLKNEVDNLETKISQLKKENTNVLEQCKVLVNSRSGLKGKISVLKKEVISQQNLVEVLKTQLQNDENLFKEATAAKEETKKIRSEMDMMKKIEVLLIGSKESANALLQEYGSSECSRKTRDVATVCAAVKQEYTELKTRYVRRDAEFRKMKQRINKLELAQEQSEANIEEFKEQITSLKTRESILKEENANIRSKMQKMVSAFESPSDTRTSAVSRLMRESPAPNSMTPDAGSLEKKYNNKQRRKYLKEDDIPIKKPRLSTSFYDSDSDSSDSENISKTLKIKTSIKTESPGTIESKKISSEYGLKYVKIKSLTNKQKPMFAKPQDILQARTKNFVLQTSNAKSKSASSSITRVGYNGLGGHSRHVFGSTNTKTDSNRTKLKLMTRK